MIFPVTYTRLLARELELDRGGLEAMLAGTGLTPEALTRLEQQVCEEAQFTIVRNVIRLSGGTAFGLRWGSHLHVTAHGALGMLIASSPTLGDAMRNLERFDTVRGEFTHISRRMDQGFLILELGLNMPLDEVGLFFMEALVATVQEYIRLLLGRWMTEGSIELGYDAPAHAERYPEYLHCPYRFGASGTRVLIPQRLLDLPNPLSDAEAHDQALLRCEEVQAAQRLVQGWRQQVAVLIRRRIGHLPTLQEAAGQLGVSTRTLMRHLKVEGTNYQALLDEELGRQGKQLLASPRHTVESVALALGYREVSAFRRAFRRWFGISPSEYRQRQLH